MDETSISERQLHVSHALASVRSLYEQGALPPCLEPLLELAPPPGNIATVSFVGADLERLARQDARASTRDAEAGGVRIHFTPGENGVADITPEQALRELVEVQHEAEDRPQLDFVALKYLRDQLLPHRSAIWAHSRGLCQRTVARAIETGWLVTEKVPNPRNPDFPVTAVRLDRTHAVIAAIVADLDASAGSRHREVERETSL